MVSTVDLLIEDVHFELSSISPFQLGRKALAVNLSDMAAMGAVRRWVLISLAVPSNLSVGFFDDFFSRMRSLAEAHSVSLLGGIPPLPPIGSSSASSFWGEGEKDSLLYRHGAQPGDDLYVTGTLGDSLRGLHPAKSLGGKTPPPEEQFLLQKHLDPVPRLREGKILADRKIATAMIDVSDGLLSDLKPIGEESRVGDVIWAERILQSEAFRSLAPGGPGQAWKWALKGGGDYELLFSVPPEKASELRALAQEWPCGTTRIGRIEPLAHGVFAQDEKGTVDPAELKGYDHFA